MVGKTKRDVMKELVTPIYISLASNKYLPNFGMVIGRTAYLQTKNEIITAMKP